jgi:[protein-PII] uridylyltransferase
VLQKSGHDLPGLNAGALFDHMSPRYVLSTEVEDIVSHMDLYNSLKNEVFVWNVRHDETCNSRIVTVCAKDRPGLFSKIAGVFTLNHINILDAQANTWNNGVALDIFVVEPPPDQLFEEERWQRVKDHLGEVLTGKLDLAARLAQAEQTTAGNGRIAVSHRPNRVVIDNESSSFFTIIEVFASDFKGLLFKITDVISRLGLNIAVAKVATKVDQVVDVFYVRDESEAKIKDQAFIEKIKKEILTGLPF